MNTPLLAFHNKTSVRTKNLRRIRAHAKADEIIKGTYWEEGRGCAVGCTLHSDEHMAYETELGIPVALARLEDRIFEGLPIARAKQFPAQFLSAPKVGADLSRVSWQFLHWILTEELTGRDHPLVRDAIKQCADVLVPLTKGEPVNESAAESAASAAWSAESAASAASAAWSAESAAASAARSAESAAYVRMADKLIELMEAA